MGLQHSAHTVSQTESHRHRQALGHGNNDKCHSYHDGLQHIRHKRHHCEWFRDKEVCQSSYDHERSNDIRHTGDKPSKVIQLFVEWCLHTVINLYRLVHLAILRRITNLVDHHCSVAFHHLGTAHHGISGECSISIKVAGVYTLMTDRFTSKSRLINIESGTVHQRSVGRHLVARSYHHHITYHHLSAGYLHHRRCSSHATDDLHRFLIAHLIQQGKLFVGLILKKECQSCGKEYSNKDTYRFEEHRQSIM